DLSHGAFFCLGLLQNCHQALKAIIQARFLRLIHQDGGGLLGRKTTGQPGLNTYTTEWYVFGKGSHDNQVVQNQRFCCCG
ncbi:hypothetical protein, partial [Pseudomonas chlororaphis]|uniref:hypothetical protein n=1 Tax=Pseudomonas chlororaphis TaxID=587753 RepID=UPI001C82CA94